ncbi:MAG: MinD/ParA family protein [Clostridiales bacterium]|jgi:flagellar biosynthesis protein FlhG|nr:MinD/ParA family protein [Clostridiales bacterium]
MDQANALRGRIRQREEEYLSNNFSKYKNGGRSKLLAVSSGKGGVGKTNFALNLAIGLLKQGKKVIVIDADFGLANIEILLGLSPRFTLLDVFSGDKNIEDIIITGPHGLKFISGGNGLSSLPNINSKQLSYIISNLAYLDRYFDYIIIDTGAGISDSVVNFIRACEDIIVITTPEPTAITDAYSLIKASVDGFIGAGGLNFKLVVNKVDNTEEGFEAYNKLSKVCEKYLGITVCSLGSIPDDANLVRAVKKQEPVTISFPGSASAAAIEKIGFEILDIKQGPEPFGIISFVKKLVGIFNG